MIEEKAEFYINSINDVFAEIFIESPVPHNFKMKFEKTNGLVTIIDINNSDNILVDGIDFELSTSECCGLNSTQLSDYVGKTVYTSSALEYFDFVFGFCKEVEFDMELKGGSWKIMINSYK